MGTGDIVGAAEGFTEAARIERRLDDPFWLTLCLGNLAVLAGFMEDLGQVRTRAEEALAVSQRLKQRWTRIIPLSNLAWAERRQGNEARANLLDDEIRANLKNINHPIFMPISIGLGTEARLAGRFEDARAIINEAFKMAQRMHSKNLQASFRSDLAHITRLEGRLDEAEQEYRQLIAIWYELGHRGAVANLLECLGFIARGTGRRERAAQLLGAAEALREVIQMPMREYERLEYDPEVAVLREAMQPDAFASAWSKGRAMSLEDAVQLALGEMP
jgi:tetratricopeptide (TPR) repeat protein